MEELVPQDHLVRQIDNAIDFNFIYDEVKDLYDVKGKPSIGPVSLIKIVLVQYMFGIRSMRQTIKEIKENKIIFVIAHKLNDLSVFDKVLQLENGRLLSLRENINVK